MTQPFSGGGWVGDWSPGIGDPTFAGWLTAFAYLGAAALCFRNERRLRAASGDAGPTRTLPPLVYAVFGLWGRLARTPPATRLASLWRGLAVVMLGLGINKQLDLQTALTEIGRIMARSEGWYAGRRKIQVQFIVAVLLVGIWMLGVVFAMSRGFLARLWPVLLGSVFLVCFVAIRASSFHHVDRLLHLELGGLRVNWILELGGICLVAFGAWRAAPALTPAKGTPATYTR